MQSAEKQYNYRVTWNTIRWQPDPCPHHEGYGVENFCCVQLKGHFVKVEFERIFPSLPAAEDFISAEHGQAIDYTVETQPAESVA